MRFDTALGAFEVELDTVRAPITVENFLRYVDGGFYDGGRVHRSARLETQAARPVKIEVIQAGIDPARNGDAFPAIPLERTSATGILHKDGVISMARSSPDTATSDFFICIGDQPSLDFGGARNPDGQGFAAFGRVVSGMDVVRSIHKASAAERSSRLRSRLRGRRASRQSSAARRSLAGAARWGLRPSGIRLQRQRLEPPTSFWKRG